MHGKEQCGVVLCNTMCSAVKRRLCWVPAGRQMDVVPETSSGGAAGIITQGLGSSVSYQCHGLLRKLSNITDLAPK